MDEEKEKLELANEYANFGCWLGIINNPQYAQYNLTEEDALREGDRDWVKIPKKDRDIMIKDKYKKK
jgi:hypothetical protein